MRKVILDPESVRIVLDLAHAELERMEARGPNENSIGRLAFDDVARVVGWMRYPEEDVSSRRAAPS